MKLAGLHIVMLYCWCHVVQQEAPKKSGGLFGFLFGGNSDKKEAKVR